MCIRDRDKADNALLVAALGYEAAQARLAQYALRDGRPAVTETRQVLGDQGEVIAEEVWELEPPIPPIPETLADGTPHPDWWLVTLDDAERAARRLTISQAPWEVAELYRRRQDARAGN